MKIFNYLLIKHQMFDFRYLTSQICQTEPLFQLYNSGLLHSFIYSVAAANQQLAV